MTMQYVNICWFLVQKNIRNIISKTRTSLIKVITYIRAWLSLSNSKLNSCKIWTHFRHFLIFLNSCDGYKLPEWTGKSIWYTTWTKTFSWQIQAPRQTIHQFKIECTYEFINQTNKPKRKNTWINIIMIRNMSIRYT